MEQLRNEVAHHAHIENNIYTQKKTEATALFYSCLPKQIIRFLVIVIFLLLSIHLIAHFIYFRFPELHFSGWLVHHFGLNNDRNAPTLFNMAILFLSAILLYLTARRARLLGERNASRYWLLLCFIFIFLALDEILMVHEFAGGLMRKRMDKSVPGYLIHAWVIPYLFFALVVGLSYVRFVFRLPARIRNLIFAAGFLYVGSALGMEMLEGAEEASNGKNYKVLLLQTIEEVLEMLALTLFVYTLMQYLNLKRLGLKIN